MKAATLERIEMMPTADLVPYARNSRTHSDEQVGQIMASIREFGFTNPVLIDEAGTIIAGHGRVLAAQRMELDTVPCRRLTHLSEAQKRAYVIADNRLALNAGWDSEQLANELQDLQTDEFDLSLLGFEPEELEVLLGLSPNAGDVVEDEVPDVPADPITQPGDLWILGDHRLLCGDSTKSEDEARLMNGAGIDTLIMDPPYGIDWEGSNASTLEWGGIANDTGTLNLTPLLIRSGVVVSFGANCYPHQLPHRGRWIVWDKRVNENADRMLGSPFEMAWTNSLTGFDKIYRIMHGGAVNADGHNARRVHPTQKPVRLMASIIEDFATGDVIDLFLGSGTTLIAAEQLNRRCYGMEISPVYCDVIVKRWETLTERKATLEQPAQLQEA